MEEQFITDTTLEPGEQPLVTSGDAFNRWDTFTTAQLNSFKEAFSVNSVKYESALREIDEILKRRSVVGEVEFHEEHKPE